MQTKGGALEEIRLDDVFFVVRSADGLGVPVVCTRIACSATSFFVVIADADDNCQIYVHTRNGLEFARAQYRGRIGGRMMRISDNFLHIGHGEKTESMTLLP